MDPWAALGIQGCDVPPEKPTSVQPREHHSIACMEVWGGSSAFAGVVAVPGHDVQVACTPHVGDQNGGDIYYVSGCNSGLITRFVLADVAGHGEKVAALARGLRDLMRKHINTADQTGFARALNAAFAGLEHGGRFATALLVTYLSTTDHLIVCNAGHPPPLLYRAKVGAWYLLTSKTPGVRAARGDTEGVGIRNLPLGVLDPTDYEQIALGLDEGDRVLMYTDALMEATLPDGRQIGAQGVLDAAKSLDPASPDLARLLQVRVGEVAGTREFDDDATVIALFHTGSNPPRMTVRDLPHRVAGWLGLGGLDTAPGETSESR